MIHEPYIIPKNVDVYSDPDAAKVYPKISEIASGDLVKRHENIAELEEFLDYTNKLDSYLNEVNPFPRPKLEVFWSCIACQTRVNVNPEILNNEDSEEISTPIYCKDPMKMIILKGNQVYQEIRLKHNKIIQESLEQGEAEQAGIGFLDLVLAFLEDYSHAHLLH